jgi:hypothetical protein
LKKFENSNVEGGEAFSRVFSFAVVCFGRTQFF